MKCWIVFKQFTAAAAKWSVHLSPYPAPDNLEKALCLFHQAIRGNFDRTGMRALTREEVQAMVRKHFIESPEVRAWNNRKNGNDAPFKFVSVFNPASHPDDDFIDLGALEANIVREIWAEAEEYPALALTV